MNKAISEFLVGATVLLGLVGVAVLLMLFGEFTGVRRDTYPVGLVLSDATGLTRASRVTLNGVPVATIGGISPAPDPRDGVTVNLLVTRGVRIPRDAEVFLDRGLVGEASLTLRSRPLPPGAPDPGYLDPGETIRKDAPGMLDQIASMLDERLGSFTGAASSLSELSDSLAAAAARLNEALEQRSPGDVDSGKAPANLVSTIARIDMATRDARLWLSDESARRDAASALRRFNDLLESAAGAVEEWSRTAESLRAQAESLGGEASASLRSFSETSRALGEAMHEVQGLVARVNAGEGTMGMLVNNPDLYRSMNDAAVRLERALTEAQMLFEKYRREGIPLRF